MKMLGPAARKALLIVHVVASVGWLGAAASFLALAVVGLRAVDPATVRAMMLAIAPITRFVVVPAAFATLATGLVQGLMTPWGLVRHYWAARAAPERARCTLAVRILGSRRRSWRLPREYVRGTRHDKRILLRRSHSTGDEVMDRRIASLLRDVCVAAQKARDEAAGEGEAVRSR